VAFARKEGLEARVVQAAIDANEHQMARMVDKIVRAIGAPRGKRVGVLGLSFKPNTDDLREAPALAIVAGLRRRGVRVTAFDPVAMPLAQELLGRRIAFAEDAYQAARDADALVIVTEWNEFRNLNLGRLRRLMRRPVLCDLRNIYRPEVVEAAGMKYVGVGRGRVRRRDD
jgi:UDPglucose 6-dehydrogenase